MFSTMEQCTNFIFKLRANEYKGEPLASIRILLQALGNPEQQSKFIHIAGSNGKGSTLNATREILMAHGLRVGAFISPHLERPNERVTINKQQITDEKFLAYANKVADAVHEKLDGKFPSFFEFMTIIGFLHFAHEDVDYVVLETGIGGRLDSTNVVTPEVSVITTISLEHTAMLGDTYELVALEKAGIIKTGKPVVVGVKQSEARQTIKTYARQLHAPLFVLGEQIIVTPHDDLTFDYEANCTFKNVNLSMKGLHQMENAALAITACELVLGDLHEQSVREALQQAVWEGRFEQPMEQVVLDGAHNSEGTAALIQTLQAVYPSKKYHFIYAAMADKDHANSIQLMDEVATSITFAQIDMPNAKSAEALHELSTHVAKQYATDWQPLLKMFLRNKGPEDVVVVTGSLYFIAEVRQYLRGVMK
jgi:dihydrofolate synthase / folylpolyglutamate synthase